MKKILVIEDTSSIREETLTTLTFEGFTAIGAENGQVGVQMAQQHQPDLIICDVMMPELDGHGVLRTLRENPATATVPFIFLTARADKQDLRQGMDLGADDYITKPFLAQELIGAINTRLAKSKTIEMHSEKKLEELRGNIGWALPHELRTPLAGILGSADLLIDAFGALEPEKCLQIIKNIRSSASQLNRLIENYLKYVHIELLLMDKQKAEECRQSRCEATDEIVAKLATSASEIIQRESDLKLEIAPAAARISAGNLTHIVAELVDNAFKFSEPGTPVMVRSAATGRLFSLTISNHGRGLSPDQIARIGAYMQFDRDVFEQQGSGLGLIIARRLAELHGGHMTITSVPNRETAVTVTLPA